MKRLHFVAATLLACAVFGDVCGAERSSNLPAQHLDMWSKGPIEAIQIDRAFPSAPGASTVRVEEGIRLDTLVLPVRDAVVGLGVTGTVQLGGKRSLVPVVLLHG